MLDVVLSELGYHLLELFLGVAPVCQGLLKVVPGNLPVAVGVIVLESLKLHLFIDDEFLVAGGNHEFLKLNVPVLVMVYAPEYFPYLPFGQVRFK
jgi:hypothetical protein